MSRKDVMRPYLKRLGLAFLICLVFILAFNEITYRFLKESGDRAPQAVQIIIPAGTAARIAAGEMVDSIPDELIFVAGDVLEVSNLDNTDHQLGPLWIPAGTTASLALDLPDKMSYSCSFSPRQYLEIDVRQPTTLSDRIIALTLGVPTLTVLVFLYSLAAKPIDRDGGQGKKNGQANLVVRG